MRIRMDRPNQYTVLIGDRLIVPYLHGKGLSRLFVDALNPNNIFASNETFEAAVVPYDKAVIMKENGDCLFGKDAEERLFGRGFGGIRVLI